MQIELDNCKQSCIVKPRMVMENYMNKAMSRLSEIVGLMSH